jgi:predicted unusual protein kinase regulating ubiquinone biosynthesis (AarF/ABC1/UbiB family)
MLSIRPDIMPPAFIYELQKLCDAVPSFPTEQAIATIELELGRSVEDLFEDLHLETLPIASASLGQVRNSKIIINKLMPVNCIVLHF